ncbi:MAG: hypothetical protein M3362_13945 [Acidobacteriota bacterium]|nr:hypothetical protein [Acidobacteriota bacterium]
MARLLKSIIGLIIGIICGAAIGAAMLAIPTYLDDNCGFLGCSRDWTLAAIYMGVIIGIWPGALIGFIVGIGLLNKSQGACVGTVIGLIILIVLLGMGAGGDALITGLGVVSIPMGALVGLTVATLLGLISISEDNI